VSLRGKWVRVSGLGLLDPSIFGLVFLARACRVAQNSDRSPGFHRALPWLLLSFDNHHALLSSLPNPPTSANPCYGGYPREGRVS
jgi:hypothetical protein